MVVQSGSGGQCESRVDLGERRKRGQVSDLRRFVYRAEAIPQEGLGAPVMLWSCHAACSDPVDLRSAMT